MCAASLGSSWPDHDDKTGKCALTTVVSRENFSKLAVRFSVPAGCRLGQTWPPFVAIGAVFEGLQQHTFWPNLGYFSGNIQQSVGVT